MKLRYRKNGTNHDLNLLPIKPAGKAWALNWRDRVYYAELIAPSNSRASDLRIRCGGEIYALAEVQRNLSKMLTYSGTTAVTLNGTEQVEGDSSKLIFAGDLDSTDYNSACISITAADGANNGDAFILKGNAKNNWIDMSAVAGGATIDPGTGNDTVLMGDGDELIICDAGSGSEVLVGFASNDTIQLRGYNNQSATYNFDGETLIFTIGGGTIKLTNIFENAAELDVTFVDDDGNEINLFDETFRHYAIAKNGYVTLKPNATDYSAFPDDIQINAAQVTVTPLSIDASNANATIIPASVNTAYTFGEEGGTVTKFKANDTLNIDEKIYSCGYDPDHSLMTFGLKNDDLELRGVTSNGIYLNGATKIYVGDDILYNNANLQNATGVTLVANYRENFSVVEQGMTGNISVDATDNEQEITITGGDGNDYIIGGATIQGGAGNDTLFALENSAVITGGAGNDLFVVNAKGNKLITDFTTGSDQLSLSAEDFDALQSISIDGTNLTLNFEQGTLTLQNVGSNPVITINGTGYRFTPEAIWNTARTKVTLLSAATIDATESPYDTAISIYAKSGGSINASGRSDSITVGGANGVELIGTSQNDDFIYGGGDATINYSKNDRFSMKSGLVMGDYTINGGVLQVQISDSYSNPKGILTFYGMASVIADDSGTDSDTQGTPLTMVYSDGTLRNRYFNPYGAFNKKNPKYATEVIMNSRRGDYGVQKDKAGNAANWFDTNPVAMTTGEYFANLTTVVSAFNDSTVRGNAKANEIYINGGGYYNIVGGQLGKDSITFGGTGGGIIADFGIAAPQSGEGKTYASAVTTSTYNRFDVNKYFANWDYLKIKGTVTGVYYATNKTITATKAKKIPTVNVLITYTDLNGEEQVIFLPHVNKKATTTNSTNEAKRVWNSHTDAVATLKIWHGKTAGTQLTGTALSGKYKDINDFPEHLRPRVIELYRRYKNLPFTNSWTGDIYPTWLFT